jgi:hypothetical protein
MSSLQAPRPAARATTIVRVQPSGKATNVPVRTPTGSVRRITADDVRDPHRLARFVEDIQTSLSQQTAAARSDPFAGSVLFQNVPVTNGVTFVLRHNMGRAWRGYLVTRCYSAAVSLSDGTLGGGLTVQQAVALVPTATGTIDVMVF